jgi:hypothetical protein
MTAMTSDLNAPHPPIEVPGVLGRLEATRGQIKASRAWTGAVTFFLGALAITVAFMLADWFFVLPPAIRGLIVPALFGLAVSILFRTFRPYAPSSAAALVEASFPTLGQRIRTLIQYHGPSAKATMASPALLRALGRETDEKTAGLDFRKIVPWAKFERRAVGLVFAFLASVIGLFLVPSLRTAALRMMFLPAHYTTMTVEPGDLTLKAGEELKLHVTLSGRPVSSAHWLYREQASGADWTSVSLPPDREGKQPAKPLIGTIDASLKDCQADLEYRVVAGDGESPIFHVRVVHPLLMTDLQTTVIPPPYTGRKPGIIKQRPLQVIEGSTVDLQIALNHAPTHAELVLNAPGEAPVQVALNKIADAKVAGRLATITRDAQYQIKAVDAEGMELEIEPFQIKVIRDQKPTLSFIRPDESLAVTPTTEVPIEVEAGDDFGVSRLGISYKVGDGPEETLHLADYKDQSVTAKALATLYLEKHPIAYPNEISYFAFALDNYPTEPHRVVSEMRFIDILPYKKEYQFVEGGQGEPSSGSMSLEELIARQRVNLSRTFVLEGDRSIDEKAASRLASFEEELAAATTEFSEGLKARGIDIPALDEAAGAMKSATTALDKKDLPAARSLEEAALKSLIGVRQNLRTLLALNQGAQASACRTFDRQQVQKIRRPKEDKKEQLEAELMELAKREEEFSEEIEAKGGGGAEVEPPPANAQQPENPEEPPSKESSSSSSSSPKDSNKASQARSSTAEDQQRAAEEAQRLSQLAQKDRALTESAKARLEAAAKMVQESSDAMKDGKSAEAALKAREAARKLELAARQVGALKAKELADALARERDAAQAIARAERELGKSLDPGAELKEGQTDLQSQKSQNGAQSKQAGTNRKSGPGESKDGKDGGPNGLASSKQGENRARSGATGSKMAGTGGRRDPAAKQRDLADDLRALADVLDRLRSDAALDYRELAQAIEQATRRNPPEEVEDSMRRNAEVIAADKKEQAARDAEAIALRLESLAQDLESVRREAVQPQLERLLAAEKQAAQLQERLRSMRQPSHLAEVEKGVAELSDLVDKLAPGQGSMRQAADRLNSAIHGAHTGVLTRSDRVVDDATGYYVPPTGYNDGLLAVTLALQARIQEIILDSALADRDGRVPPRYREMVDDYYRVLSQDLR